MKKHVMGQGAAKTNATVKLIYEIIRDLEWWQHYDGLALTHKQDPRADDPWLAAPNYGYR